MFSIIASRSASRSALCSTRTLASTSRYSSTRYYSSTMHDNDPETLEREKQRNLSKTQRHTSTPHEHAPDWNEHLASSSEAFVKADQSNVSPEDLARQTVDYVQSRHSPDDRVAPREASYATDSVLGPLSSAKGTEEHGTTIKKTTVHDEKTEVIEKK